MPICPEIISNKYIVISHNIGGTDEPIFVIINIVLLFLFLSLIIIFKFDFEVYRKSNKNELKIFK